MGCGSSSLKGEGGSGVDPQPIRKVNTNFSTINYDQSDNKKRRNTEYAPDDTIRNRSEASGAARISGDRPQDDIGPGGEKLEPYRTAGDGTELKDMSYPHENANGPSRTDPDGPDPTTDSAKDKFASDNDPVNNSKGSGMLSPDSAGGDAGKGRRTSWLARLKPQERKELTDEDLKKHTGMTRAEMDEWAKTQPVGPRASATDAGMAGMGAGGPAAVGAS